MTELRNRTGETVQVAVLDGREVVYVERLDSPNTLRLFLEVGRRNSAHSTGCGKALLAFLSARPARAHAAQLEAAGEDAAHDHRRRRAAQGPRRGPPPRVRRQPPRVGGRRDLGRGSDPRTCRGASVAAISVAGPAERLEPHELPLRPGDGRVGGVDLAAGSATAARSAPPDMRVPVGPVAAVPDDRVHRGRRRAGRRRAGRRRAARLREPLPAPGVAARRGTVRNGVLSAARCTSGAITSTTAR